QPTGPALRMHHRRGKGDGRLAEAMRDSHRRPAIDRSVLDRGLRHSGGSGFGSIPGECPGDEEFARAQERCAGKPMAHEAAHLWAVAEFVSAPTRDSHHADVLAATARLGASGRAAYSADAEGADADESSVSQCV